jgi:SAM-dependent methyltransferase
MDVPPDDPAARQESLQHWAAEQRGKYQRAAPVPSRTRLARARIQRRFRLARASVRRHVVQGSQRVANRVLDRGLDTAADATEPEHDHPDRVPYQASGWHVLPRALRYLGVSDSDTFVDFGCGKGRVVHQAARRPFRRVIGVEISPALAETARAALAARSHRHRCRNVEIVVADAREFRVPDDLTIAYLAHPFSGETFEAVLQGIVASIDRHPRRVRLIYVEPVHRSQILATGRFRLLTEQRTKLLDRRPYPTAIFESH